MTNSVQSDQPIFKRRRHDYPLLEQEIMILRKKNVLNDLKVLQLTGKSSVFENQEIIASKTVTCLKDRKIICVMVVAKTQSGKTGSMCATIKQYLEDPMNLIPIENIYIITGLSSCEWKEQTKERMPEGIQKRVFHRCELPNTFVDEIRGKHNIIIMMDEIQVAAKKGQTIYNCFKNAGLLDKSKLYEKDIKIIEFTATPDGTIYDLMKWKNSSSKILADGGDGYISSFDLLNMGRVKQYKELCGYNEETENVNEAVFENIQEIKIDISNYTIPRYHIIRTRSGKYQEYTIDNFKRIFQIDEYEFIKYDTESQIEDINKILREPPSKHTLIFIKGMLRCAKTIEKEFLGVLYERYCKTPDDASIIQGLIGRDTGYDNNGVSICYTNKSSIERYEKLWRSEFEDKTIEWNSKTTTFANGLLSGRSTFNELTENDEISENKEDVKEPVIKKFKTQEEGKEYYLKELKDKMGGNGPNRRKPNVDGYYIATIRNITGVYSCEDIYKERRCNISNGAGYAFRPCYVDIKDKSTLQWWFIHY